MDDMMGMNMDVIKDRALPDIQKTFNCTGSECDPHLEAFADHPTWYCDATPILEAGGSHIGHVWPGCIFILWASHWLLGIVRVYFERKRRGDSYYSLACQRVLWLPASWHLEAFMKVLLPLICITLELKYGHENSLWRTLICPADSERPGHIWGNHINNWQHAAMYPGFIVSGIVDLVGLKVELPQGISQIGLALAFLAEAMLMGLHKKHDPLDIIVHELLFYAMMSSCVFSLLEGLYPHNFLLSCGRVAGTYLQGTWFIATARVLYEGRTAWDPSQGDLAPTMYVPIVFTLLSLAITAGIFLAWLAGFAIYRPAPVATSSHMEERTGLLQEDDDMHLPVMVKCRD